MEYKKEKYDNNTVNYARATEAICDSYFAVLTGSTGWFNSVYKLKENSVIDYKAVDAKNRNVNIELKTRKLDTLKYDSLMIEPNKYSTLTGSTGISLFINFFDNSNIFCLCTVNEQLNDSIVKTNKRITIKSNINNNYDYDDYRYYIPFNKCIFYSFDNQSNSYKIIDKNKIKYEK